MNTFWPEADPRNQFFHPSFCFLCHPSCSHDVIDIQSEFLSKLNSLMLYSKMTSILAKTEHGNFLACASQGSNSGPRPNPILTAFQQLIIVCFSEWLPFHLPTEQCRIPSPHLDISSHFNQSLTVVEIVKHLDLHSWLEWLSFFSWVLCDSGSEPVQNTRRSENLSVKIWLKQVSFLVPLAACCLEWSSFGLHPVEERKSSHSFTRLTTAKF